MTKLGGRDATVRHIAGECALSVGMPNALPPRGWRWVRLTDVAKLESGHTPSRRHPEYWGGEIPWLSIRDAKAHHGNTIRETIEYTNPLGIENSSARILPSGTVCLSRTASVGYVTIMGQAMATSQDFVNWACTEQLDPRFLQYLLICEGPNLDRFSSGAVHQTIYFPEVKAFHVCIPSVAEQRRIVTVLDDALGSIAAATANTETNLASARKLFEFYQRKMLSNLTADTRPLGELASFRNGINFTGSSKGEVIRIVGVKDFQNNLRIPFEGLATVQIDGKLSTLDLLTEGDILSVRSNGNKALIGRCMIAGEQSERTAHSGFTIRIRPDRQTIDPHFLCRILKSPSIRERLVSGSAGANISSLNQGALATLPIPVLPFEEQHSLVAAFDDVERETEKLALIYINKLAALGALKQSILHHAFTGELTAPAMETKAA